MSWIFHTVFALDWKNVHDLSNLFVFLCSCFLFAVIILKTELLIYLSALVAYIFLPWIVELHNGNKKVYTLWILISLLWCCVEFTVYNFNYCTSFLIEKLWWTNPIIHQFDSFFVRNLKFTSRLDLDICTYAQTHTCIIMVI